MRYRRAQTGVSEFLVERSAVSLCELTRLLEIRDGLLIAIWPMICLDDGKNAIEKFVGS